MATFVPISDIFVPADRTRREFNKTQLAELAEDIVMNGLLHPPVVCVENGKYRLIAGERRFKALQILLADSRNLIYGRELFPPASIPVNIRPHETEDRLLEIEIAENLKRVDLSWQERVSALSRLHKMREAQNPDQTITATAHEAAGPLNIELAHARKEISRSLIIDQHLDNPRIAKAKSVTEAWTIIQQDLTQSLKNNLRERLKDEALETGLGPDTNVCDTSRHVLHEGDFKGVVLPRGQFSAVIADPPYGINADKMTRQKTARHFYADDEETARDTAFQILAHAYTDWLAEDGSLFMFCTPNLWHELYAHADLIGFSCWHRPIIWQKSREGLAPWGNKGFRYTYEMILWAVKGTRGLLTCDLDILDYPRSQRGKLHGAQKPVALYAHLLELSCLPGEHVLDPCCGSGTIFPAATLGGFIATGIEMDPHYVGVACNRMSHTAILENEE